MDGLRQRPKTWRILLYLSFYKKASAIVSCWRQNVSLHGVNMRYSARRRLHTMSYTTEPLYKCSTVRLNANITL
ncbi:hypothetical protein F4820DRAFT_417474 [Hypoxylon rubiginosum]|uniref:Uncharacterized protein n=1 Tax=Hypoxylon rubiginosum TaxID=110542 RepID=A0ACB9Z3W2_9PEZI|nr:hypothetical protein F4820DRAFT_417474 [Hypoxylon rubiginosum]